MVFLSDLRDFFKKMKTYSFINNKLLKWFKNGANFDF